MVFDITISKIEVSLRSMGWNKAKINFVTHELEDENGDGVVSQDELLCFAESLKALAEDLRKIAEDAQNAGRIYKYLRDNKLDFAEFEEMAHLLLD